MKTSRADNFIRRNIEYKDYRTRRSSEYKKEYQLFTSNIQWKKIYDWRKDVGIQCDSRSVNGRISPRRTEIVYYSGFPKQVYAYSRARSFTNVGVGSEYQQRKKVRKIYLPETENRGVGSSDLSSIIDIRKCRIDREPYSYARNKMSTKCVGGGNETVYQCTEKLSTISFWNNSKGNIVNVVKEKIVSKDIGNNTMGNNLVNTTTQVENNIDIKQVSAKQIQVTKTSKERETTNNEKTDYSEKKLQGSCSIHKSSDSLEQHVHNLEDPSSIQSTGSSDPMENKMEKEYRKIFSNKSKDDKIIIEKPMLDLKSTSLLRRRFEALKRGIVKKEDSKKNNTPPSQESGEVFQTIDTPIHRDISIESDPPSLEARSYSHTKIYSPTPPYKRDRRSRSPRYKSQSSKKDKDLISPLKYKVEDADVKGMFKMWGEKFNFEDDKKTGGLVVTFDTKEKVLEPKTNDPKGQIEDKKEGKRFFFFKKKSKDKTKPPNDKKGVTAGRCEVKTCSILSKNKAQTGDNNQEAPKKVSIKPDEDDILKKKWLRNFIQRTIESRKSLQIRWNNKMYKTSSSTVFELMDNMYRQANIVITSQSETSTVTSYQSRNKHHVNFVQDIEAWMVPKLVQHRKVPYFVNRNEGNNRMSDRKWFIDKSKAFAHEIELVLNSNKVVTCHRTFSSDYLRIDIPTGFFSDPSSESDKFATSNSEEVYKIIEYESPESEIRYNVKDSIGDYSHNDIRIQRKVSVRDKNIDTMLIETVIKKPPVHRDVVIQGSNVHVPKRCDVIGVGIITHRREIGKSILNIEGEDTGEDSDRLMGSNIKQCQLAESYLRDYYRHWMPLGIDLFPDRVSDFYVKCESHESMSSIHNQGDGTKSCPNISNDFHSNNMSGPISNSRGSCKDVYMDKTKIFNNYKSMPADPTVDARRVLPKDSFEVLRKRMLYACGNRSKWNGPNDPPYSVPSIEDKAEQDPSFDYSKKQGIPNRKRVATTPKCDKPGCDYPEPSPDGILSYTKKSVTSISKRTTLNEDENIDILPPACKEYCISEKIPPCSPKSSSSSFGSRTRSPSPTKITSPLDENLPCKRNAPCREISRRSFNEYQCPCPCNPAKKHSESKDPNYLPNKPMIKMPNSRDMNGCLCKSTEGEERNPPPCVCGKSSHYLPLKSSIKLKAPSYEQQLCPSCHSKCPRLLQTSYPTPQSNPLPRRAPCVCLGHLRKGQSNENTRPDVIHGLPAISTQTLEDLDCGRGCKPCSSDPVEPVNVGDTKPKLEGVHLKVKPAMKSSISIDDEQETNNEMQSCDTCQEDQVLIRVKGASCDSCRDGVNVKVQDEDGRTLFERRDYKMDHGTVARPSLLEDFFKVNRLSTLSEDKFKDNFKQPKSISNMIEISFGVKVTQGDKIAEIDLSGVNDSSDGIETKSKDRKSQDVFIVNSEADTAHDDPNDKNDINIKIVIKNFDTKSTKSIKKYNDNFAKTISQKFNTVSTGYSDVLENHIDDMYSMHRTTIDLTDSKSQPLANITTDDEKVLITPEKLQEPEKPSSKDTIAALASFTDFKQRDHFMQNSKTSDAVNRSRHGIIEDMRKTISINVLPHPTWQKYMPHKIKDEKFTKIGDDEETREKTVSKNVKESESAVGKSNTEYHTCYKTTNRSPIEQIKNTASIKKSGRELDFKNSDTIVTYDEKKSYLFTGECLSTNEDTVVLRNEDPIRKESSVTNKTSKVQHVPSRTENDVLSLIRKSVISKGDYDGKNNNYLQGNSVTAINKLSKPNSKDNTPKCVTPESKSVSKKRSQESKILSKRGSQSPEKNRSEIASAAKLHSANKNMIPDSIKEFERSVNIKKSEIKHVPSGTENDMLILKRKSVSSKRDHDDKNNNYLQGNSGTAINKLSKPNSKDNTPKCVTPESKSVSKKRSQESKILSKRGSQSPEKIRSEITSAAKLHNPNKNMISDPIREFESGLNIKKSEINHVPSRTENDVLILKRKSVSSKGDYDVKNNCYLQGNSVNAINKVSKPNSKNNTPKCVTPESNSVSKKRSQESKILSKRGSQSPEKIRSEVPSAAKLHNANKYMISDILENILKHDKLKFVAGDVRSESSVNQDTSEAIQSSENVKPVASEEKITDSEGLDLQTSKYKKSDIFKGDKLSVTNVLSLHEESILNESNYKKHPQAIEGDGYTDLESENEHTDLSQKSLRLTQSDTDNVLDITNTSEETSCCFPRTRAEKKDMLKLVFEKATNQKLKSKSRMKRLKNMLKSILTSDSSDVDDNAETQLTSKNLVKDITYIGYDKPPIAQPTESMNNYYMSENIVQSDEEITTDSSAYHVDRHKCLCQAMAERLRRRGEEASGGCCCRDPVERVHEQTSCNINNERDFYMVNCKAVEHFDVYTQHSLINTEFNNLIVKKMESVMTSVRCSEIEGLKVNRALSQCMDDKKCEAKGNNTSTVLKKLEDGKIVIRTADPYKASMKTEIIIDWKNKDKKKHKDKKACVAQPADVLKCYETKKAVLEIYAQKTVTKDGERLVAKLPRFVYEKEHELEKVKDILT